MLFWFLSLNQKVLELKKINKIYSKNKILKIEIFYFRVDFLYIRIINSKNKSKGFDKKWKKMEENGRKQKIRKRAFTINTSWSFPKSVSFNILGDFFWSEWFKKIQKNEENFSPYQNYAKIKKNLFYKNSGNPMISIRLKCPLSLIIKLFLILSYIFKGIFSEKW